MEEVKAGRRGKECENKTEVKTEIIFTHLIYFKCSFQSL